MTTPQFDTLRAAKTLKRGGFDETQAESVVHTLDQAVNENLGTKTDLKLLQSEMKQGFAETNATTEKAIANTEKAIARSEATTEKAIAKSESATNNAIAKSESATSNAIAKSEAATSNAIAKSEAATEKAIARSEVATSNAIAEMRTAIAEMRADSAQKSEEKFTTLYRHLWVVGASIVVIMITLFLVN